LIQLPAGVVQIRARGARRAGALGRERPAPTFATVLVGVLNLRDPAANSTNLASIDSAGASVTILALLFFHSAISALGLEDRPQIGAPILLHAAMSSVRSRVVARKSAISSSVAALDGEREGIAGANQRQAFNLAACCGPARARPRWASVISRLRRRTRGRTNDLTQVIMMPVD
jgi:hypothetical protein